MKKLYKILLVAILLLLSNQLFAQDTTKVSTENQTQIKKHRHVRGFVDENNDGYNDNAPDDDGDGIPNGLDPDYVRNKNKKKFIDLDGDGINDYIQNRGGKGANSLRNNGTVVPQSSTTGQVEQQSTAGKGQQKQKGKKK